MPGRTIPQSNVTVNATHNFCNWLESMMYQKKISQYKLAAALGVDRKTIMAILGKKRSPKLDLMAKIYDYFGLKAVYIPIDVNYFAEWEDELCRK